MGRITSTAIDPTGSFSEVIGRAAEIARAMGSPVSGPEHFFLALLHADSWPTRVLAEHGILDPAEAEAAVMSVISAPGYSHPPLLAPAPAPPIPRDNVILLAGTTVALG